MKKRTPLIIITVAALFAALTAICSWIQIPSVPIPFTMQTFAVFLSVYVLGIEKSFLSLLVYLLLGAAGLPVFSRFQGGVGVLAGATGGYLIGFLLSVLITGALLRLCRNKIVPVFFSMLAGLLICYVFGTGWFIILNNTRFDTTTIWTALKGAVLPFIIPDAVKIVIAILVGRKIKRISDKYLCNNNIGED